MSIAKLTEQELIKAILDLYMPTGTGVSEIITRHIAEKLKDRRRLIREARVKK